MVPSPGPSLRIVLVSEHASPLASAGGVDAGGQNVYVDQVARGLAALGHRVEVLTRRDAPALPAAVDVCRGVRVLHVDAGPARFVPKERLLEHMPAFAAEARRLLGGGVPRDVVHANFFMSGWVGLGLREALGLPLVTTFHALGLVRREHQGAADGFPAERIDIERRLVRESDAVIAECPQDRADLERLYGADPARVSMVPCGVDLAAFAPSSRAAARRALGVAEDDFVVLQLGRLVPRKGIDNVIRALALLRSAPRALLLVVGGESEVPDEARTPEIARLRAVAAECGVADRVRFLGRRPRHVLAACYAACDVFVTTPWYEPFGITPLEAMACARPVVGSAVGGIAYSVVDGVTGFLVPPHDPAALAGRLDRLHADPAAAAALGLAGLRRVRTMFTWDRVAGQLAEVYRRVAAPAGAVDAAEPAGRPAVAVAGLAVAAGGARGAVIGGKPGIAAAGPLAVVASTGGAPQRRRRGTGT